MTSKHWFRNLVVLVAAAALAASCVPPDDDEPAATTTTNGPVAEVADAAEVGCLTSQVEQGPTGALSTITSCNLTASPKVGLSAGGLIRVNSSGQAVVDVMGCATIHVFIQSELQVSGCSKTEQGNTYCALSGTSAMNNQCTGVVTIETPSAAAEVDGTYFSVSYDPATQITIVTSFEDEVTVYPLVELNGERGEPTEVTAGNFFFTAPNAQLDRAAAVVQQRPRTALAVDTLPAAVARLGLEPWYGSLLRQTVIDDVAVLDPQAIRSVSVRGAGGVFANDGIRDGFYGGINWVEGSTTLLRQGYTVSLSFDDEKLVRVEQTKYNPELGKEILSALADEGIEINLMTSIEEGDSAALFELISANLDALGVGHSVSEFKSRLDALAAFNESVAKGLATIWVGRS